MTIKWVDWEYRLDTLLVESKFSWESVASFMPHHYYLLGKSPEDFIFDIKDTIDE